MSPQNTCLNKQTTHPLNPMSRQGPLICSHKFNERILRKWELYIVDSDDCNTLNFL